MCVRRVGTWRTGPDPASSLRRDEKTVNFRRAHMCSLLSETTLAELLASYNVAGVSAAVLTPDGTGDASISTQVAGLASKEASIPVTDATFFQICSLSKPFAAVYALPYFERSGISMDAPVNKLLADAKSPFRFRASKGCPQSWADEVTLKHLVDHTGPQMHYVNGVPRDHAFPDVVDIISGTSEHPAPYNYATLEVTKQPGVRFGYSGGGFLVLQHLLELREGKPIAAIMEGHLKKSGTACHLGLSFHHDVSHKAVADGYREDGSRVHGGRLNFPPLAAGAVGSAAGLADWLRQLAVAYQRPEGCGDISQATAQAVLANRLDNGAEDFMRARMGIGMFVFDVASSDGKRPNRWMLHQAANDGFRGVLLVCFDGPDADRGPRGLVVFANGDNNAMLLVAAVTRALLASPTAFAPPLQGFDLAVVPSMEGGFSMQGLNQAEIVNLGFKQLVLAAFKRAPDTEGDAKRPRRA